MLVPQDQDVDSPPLPWRLRLDSTSHVTANETENMGHHEVMIEIKIQKTTQDSNRPVIVSINLRDLSHSSLLDQKSRERLPGGLTDPCPLITEISHS